MKTIMILMLISRLPDGQVEQLRLATTTPKMCEVLASILNTHPEMDAGSTAVCRPLESSK